MEEYLVLVYLALGLALAVMLTRWFNWLAWGQRRNKKERTQAQRRARMKTPESGQDEGADD